MRVDVCNEGDKQSSRSRVAVLCKVLLVLFLLGWVTVPAEARITRIVLDETSRPWEQANRSFGLVGTYTRLQGIAYGVLDPRDPHNAIIQDIKLAPRNAGGDVEYACTFTLYFPTDLKRWSGNLLYEIVNRGAALQENRFETGDAFLVSGWQGDLPFKGKSTYGTPGETVSVPIAQNKDGSAVTGAVLAQFSNMAAGLHTLPLQTAIGYQTSGAAPTPLDLDTSHASLVTLAYQDVNGFSSAGVTVPPEAWAWADCTSTPFPGTPDPAKLCVRDGFNPALLYQLGYTGKNPLVLGVGLAAMRDTVAFLRYEPKDDSGWANPLSGRSGHAIARGVSQAGNALRTFLNLGFNQDEKGRTVFDGAMSIIAARQTPVNLRFAIPGGAGSVQELGSDGTVWWEHTSDAGRGLPASGLLDRCRATKTCPRIVELLGSSEFWSLRASPDFVGTSDDHDIPVPSEVRRYYVASTQHGGGAGGFHVNGVPPPPVHTSDAANPIFAMQCSLPLNPNPMKEIMRALLVDLESWVSTGQEPPASVYPTVARGTLVANSAEAMNFPRTPQLPRPDGMANPLIVYDLGPDFHYDDLSGVALQRPSPIRKVIPPLVPATDADGNERDGIHTVLQEAALGTYLGWNVTANGFYKGQYCSLSGSYIPFARTREDRVRTYDTRLSLEERYGTQRGYACVAEQAANRLLAQRFLLPADASQMKIEAAASHVLPSDVESTADDRRIADQRCVETRGRR